jgi:hypothetical protein
VRPDEIRRKGFKLAPSFKESRIFRLFAFYAVHAIGIFAAFISYFYLQHPELLDLAQWGGAVGVALWTLFNSPKFSHFLRFGAIESYRNRCLRSFKRFIAISAVLAILFTLTSCIMLRDLFSRWNYVASIKEMTLSEGNEAIPYATAGELANAYQIYPHRKEVPFILARMSRLLAFDDEVENFNIFVKKFVDNLNIEEICEQYKNRETLEKYVGSIDPVIYLSRIVIESSPNENGVRAAIRLLDTYRPDDEVAALHRILYEHELLEIDGSMAPLEKRKKLEALKLRIDTLLHAMTQHVSPRAHLQIVTDHVFQEVLDHYAQIEIQLATSDTEFESARLTVPRLYSRVLLMRQQIARVSEVPWLHGPGKFTIYYFFQHHLGRESGTSLKITKMIDAIPGLNDSLKTKLVDVEAFREYRVMKTWDIGTPLSAEYAGTAMHRKLVEWLKSGW